MKKINVYKYIPIFLSIASLIFVYAPFQSDSTLGNQTIRDILRIILYMLIIPCFFLTIVLYLKKKNKIDKSSIFAILSILIFYFFSTFNNGNNIFEFSGLITLISCVTYLLLPNDIQLKTYRIFKSIWTIICAISIVCYLSYILDGFIPYIKTKYYSLRYYETDKYVSYGITFLYESGKYIRLCGITNEAGFFGTICAMLLCADGINLKNIRNIIILIAAIFTYSFAFFLILLIYLLLKSFKKIKIFILLLLIIISYIFILPNIKFDDPNLNYLLQRFTITDDGFKGDNRSNEQLDNLFLISIRERPIFGYGKDFVKNSQIGRSCII